MRQHGEPELTQMFFDYFPPLLAIKPETLFTQLCSKGAGKLYFWWTGVRILSLEYPSKYWKHFILLKNFKKDVVVTF